MANDNGSYWKGYLGYPSIAFLFKIGLLEFRPNLANLLKGIHWKDINQKFKNDFGKTLTYIETFLDPKYKKSLADYVKIVDEKISALDLGLLGTKTTPPEGY